MPSWYERAATCRRIAEEVLQEGSTERAEAAVGQLQDSAADEDPSVREVALRALAQVAPFARKSALDVVMVAVDDEVQSVRMEAFRTLAAAAEPGDSMAVALALHEAREPEAHTTVRTEALRVLPQVAMQGDWQTLVEVAAHAKASEAALRCAAVQTLASLSPPREQLVIAFLAGKGVSSRTSQQPPPQEATEALQPHPEGRGSVRDVEWEVRLAALTGLVRVAPRECLHACDAAGEAARDPRWEVRAAAARALQDLAPLGDLEAACILADLCKDPSFEVRRAALQALLVLERSEDGSAPHGTAVNACLECWQNSVSDMEVRTLALATVVGLLGHNAEEVVRFVAKGMEAKTPEARAAVAEGLTTVTDRPGRLLVAQIVRRIIDDRAFVRKDAIATLHKVVAKGHSMAVEELAEHVSKPDVGIRKAIVQTLQSFASRGDEVAAQAIGTRLWDEEPALRAAAVKAMADVAPFNDDNYVTRICLCLEDDNKTVREAVAEALPKIASSQSRTAIQCLTHCIRNTMKYPKRENTREAACLALAKWAESGSAEAVYVICGTISQDYPQATLGALRALALVAKRGDPAAIDGAASALAHREQRARDVATEVLEQLADHGSVAPASASAATVFEGRWTGGTIKGRKIIWGDGDIITPFEVRPGCILTSVCTDAKGRNFPCWARLDAYDRLRWDFGADWNRVLDPGKQASLKVPQEALLDTVNAKTAALERQIFGEQDAAGDKHTPPLLTQEEPAPKALWELSDGIWRRSSSLPGSELDAQGEGKADVGDVYAVAAVASYFKNAEASVRQAAVAALPRVVGKGSRAALDAVLPMMTDEAVPVRFAAVESLATVSERGDPRAIEALRVRLEDQERLVDKDTGDPIGRTVGFSAAKALKKMVKCKEDLASIVSTLSFSGPSLRGF